MLQVTQAPSGPVQVKQRFSISGTASANYVGKALALTVDNQFKANGPVVAADGSWQLNFLFQQVGNRRLKLSIANESIEVPIRVIAAAPPPPRPPRVRFLNPPQTVQAEQAVTFLGEADQYANGEQLVLRADRKYELARPRVQSGKWEAAAVVFRQTGKRLIEIIGSEQDRSEFILDVRPAPLGLQVIPRSAWTTVPTPIDLANLQPKRITIHHTALAGAPIVTGTQADEAERMRFIWRSHVNGNGWSDIGYHFIIMPSGRVFSARSEQKRGAHDVINDGIGIAFDGIYSNAVISAQQFQSAVELCTVLCQRYGFGDPTIPVATPTADYGVRNLPKIIGHRDRVATECPGSEGGRTVRLNDIRQAVKGRL